MMVGGHSIPLLPVHRGAAVSRHPLPLSSGRMRDDSPVRRRFCRWLAPAALCVVTTSATAVERFDLPLTFDHREVSLAVERELGMDADGDVLIERNACNRVRLSDLQTRSRRGQVRVSTAFEADLGTRMFGRCLGADGAQGRLLITLEPRIADDGRSIWLRFVGAELRRPDGSRGLLTRPARILADKIVLPRIEDVRVELADPLEVLDSLILSFGSEADPPLVAPSQIAGVDVLDDGIEATISLALADPRPTVSVPEPPLNPDELAAWALVEDELDGLLTTVVLELADSADDPGLKLDLLAALLDARMAIATSLVEQDEDGDPIRDLFIESWRHLAPLIERLDDETDFDGLRLAAFVAGADAIELFDRLGPHYGLDISRDGLRRLGRLLLADGTPARFTPLDRAVDPRVRARFRLDEDEPQAALEEAETSFGRWLDFFLPAAHADTVVETLMGLMPQLSNLDPYLTLVSELLVRKSDEKLADGDWLRQDVVPLFEPMVLATAWKESCWRHYLSEDEPPDVIRSSIGAVGMMQINGRVWRGIYDIEKLERDVAYNVAAGIEILGHYLVHYALRRGEDEQPGGIENLPRATYAAYNGGPSHLRRYRRDDTATRLQAIDRAFWSYFEHLRTEGWPPVSSCYAVAD